MEQKLWMLALLLALLKPQLHLFQDWFKGYGALEPEEPNSMHMQYFTSSSHLNLRKFIF